MMMRLLVDGLSTLQADWHGILIILSVLSIAIGNVVAIAQTNIKRMLAYSGISHIGFLLLGVLSANAAGYSAAMYYAVVYAIMSLGGFGMVILMSRKGFEADQLVDYKGLNERSPWFALMMMFLMFSMAGVPPFLGFWAKLAVIQAVINIDMINLAIIAVFFSVIGAFYYLRIIKLMYFDKPETEVEINPGTDLRMVFSINALAVLALGLFPDSLLVMCRSVMGL
jgi:NADH-quinone oxidoreductase subunit N